MNNEEKEKVNIEIFDHLKIMDGETKQVLFTGRTSKKDDELNNE